MKTPPELPDRKEPIFNAPAVVVVILAALCLVHAWRSLAPPRFASPATVEWWTLALAFIPVRFSDLYTNIPGGSLATATSFLTHTLVHADLTHLFINSAWLLAFGSALARRLGNARFLALYAGSAIAGALLFLAVNGMAEASLIGASGAISGLVGGAFRFFFRAVDEARFDPEGLAGASKWVSRMTLAEMTRDSRVRAAVGVWIVTNFLFALAAPWLGYAGGIAWEAHLGGFLFGLLAFDRFDRIIPRPRPDLDYEPQA